MKFTFLKLTDEQVTLRWLSEDAERSDHFTAELVSEDTPEPEFRKAFEALRSDLLMLCELPKDLAEGLTVRSVSLKYPSDTGFSVVISGARTLENSSRPLIVTAPLFKQAEDDTAHGKKGVLPEETEKKVLQVISLADAFRKGDRAQQELPLAGEKKTGRGVDATPIERAAQGELSHVSETVGKVAAPAQTPFDDDDDDEPAPEKTYAVGEVPAATGVKEYPWSGTPAATPLTNFGEINPSILAVLGQKGITSVGQLRMKRDAGEVEKIKGVGPATLETLDGVLEKVFGATETGDWPEDPFAEPEGEDAEGADAEAMPV